MSKKALGTPTSTAVPWILTDADKVVILAGVVYFVTRVDTLALGILLVALVLYVIQGVRRS